MTNEQGKYVRYAENVEVKQENEDEDVQKIRQSFARGRTAAYEKHRHAVRDAHAKSHGILKGELQIYDDLPEELKQGLFKEAKNYPVIIRYSTSPGDILPDGIAALRGMAIKVIGVEGEKILPQLKDAVTQDFVLCNHPTIAAGDVSSYLKHALFLEKATQQPEEVQRIATTALRAGAATLRAVGVDVVGGAGGQAMPETHILGETFFSQAAIRYGDYVCKLNVAPISENLKELTGKGIDTSNPSVLRDLVVEFFNSNQAECEIGIQLCTDLEKMPVEDASVEWSEEESSYRPVAKLTIPAQNAYGNERRVYGDDILSFNPWHALPEHQPLGSIQRVRKPVYDESADYRHQMNARKRVEPVSIDELPD